VGAFAGDPGGAGAAGADSAELGLSNVKVAKVWREWGLQPWRTESFKFSTDPQLEAKVRDVIGLYLNPPRQGCRGVRG
jgi:hypothetical protein